MKVAHAVLGLLSALVLISACPAQSQKPYQYFRVGNPQDVSAKTTPGFALMGGGTDLDAAFQWMCARSGGGDFLVIRATGDDAYNPDIEGWCRQNSVATLVIPTRQAANDPDVARIMSQAEAIFISGGDQAHYINAWKGSPVEDELNRAIARGIPIGGTSAGLAVQGEYIYSAQNDTEDGPDLSSAVALAEPFAHQVVVVRGFLNNPLLRDTITDTHFDTRSRMGRLMAFMARILAGGEQKTIRAIGVDERTAVLLQVDGSSTVVGKGAAYFFQADHPAQVCAAGKPLTFNGIKVQKVPSGGHFDVKRWRGDGTHYEVRVQNGALEPVAPATSVY